MTIQKNNVVQFEQVILQLTDFRFQAYKCTQMSR